MPLRFEEMPACRNMISERTFEGRGILCLEPHCLELIAEEAFKRISFFLPEGCLDSLDKIIDDPESSQNDRYVAASLIENALISSQMSLPLCQDTGAANVFAWKGGQVFTGADDRDLIAEGVRKAWSASCLRNSMLCPSSFFEETNSGSNLPAQIEIESVQGSEYSFFFLAKGGGSSNKTFLF